MPRMARIDAPGALHHVIARGIERREIFQDDKDRDNFLERLETIVTETHTPCYAWAFLPNHVHLLLRTSMTPISGVMRRLLTGYAVSYNGRHRRRGHLFQNRYKSILCQEDPYLLELVRYIHLNPMRARLVDDVRFLERYPYCGHSVLVGRGKNSWQDTDTILRLFGEAPATARRRYREFLRKGINQGKRSDLIGGGLIRSVGGWIAVKKLRETGASQKGDERILGDSAFVKTVLQQAEERLDRRYHLRTRGVDFEHTLNRVAHLMDVERDRIMGSSKDRQAVKARSIVCFWAVHELGISQTHLARRFGISQPAVSLAVRRGEGLVKQLGFSIVEN